ncbi:MAG: GPW/gp25 family protein [Acidobacteriota bacterium]|nr:GPW/gp25 family protein [Acidobacteriota bacterium]
MSGMNAKTGRRLEGIDHLRQSIRDILTTPIGSRVMRREYGSNLWRLVDAPLSGGLLTDIYAATAEALDRWEPRFRLVRVRAREAGPGKVSLDLEGEYLVSGETVRLEGVLIQ